METTLIILKPDAVQRGLMGRIISRFEDKGLQIVGTRMMKMIQSAFFPPESLRRKMSGTFSTVTAKI
jgi:nucleoside diphosphate kinase